MIVLVRALQFQQLEVYIPDINMCSLVDINQSYQFFGGKFSFGMS